MYWPTLVNATAISEIVHFENDAIPVVRACVRRPEGIGTEDDTTVHTLIDEPTTLVPRLPNLKAMNFIVYGLLGRGVAASSRIDAQGKGVGEYLRARSVPIPKRLLGRVHG